jgi:hypothetical protein
LNYTKNLTELNKDSLPETGGKGANLGELMKAGLPVPPGFIVTTGAYQAHLEASGLKERIAGRLEKLKEQDISAITEASKDISAWIEEAPMPIQSYQGFNNYLHTDMGLRLPKEPIKPVERESGCVAIRYNDPRLSPAMLWKIPRSFLKDFSKEAKDIWLPLAAEMRAWLERVEDAGRNTFDAEKIVQLFEQSLAEHGVLFGKRMSDFIPSVLTYLKYVFLLKKAVGKENADEFKERLMRDLPFRIRHWSGLRRQRPSRERIAKHFKMNSTGF